MNKSESKYFNTAIKFDKALLSLLENKAFEYVTISEVCKIAGVNRSTFYLHYENLRDLLEETVKYLINDFLSYFPDENVMFRVDECDLQDLNFINEKYLHPYLLYIKENKRVFSAVLSCPVTFGSDAVFKRLFDKIFNPILDRFHYPVEERKYVMLFYLNGLNSIITEWLKEDCKKSIEEVSDIMSYCIFGRREIDF